MSMIIVTPYSGFQNQTAIVSIINFNNNIYAGTAGASPGGFLFKLGNSNMWEVAASGLSANGSISDLAIFNNKLYGALEATPYGSFLEWNNSTSAWNISAIGLSAVSGINVDYRCLLSASDGKLYVAGNPSFLWEWNGTNLIKRASYYNANESVQSLLEYNGKIYGSTYPNGLLLEFNNATSAWSLAANIYSTPYEEENWVKKIVVYNNEIYGIGHATGTLLKWNGTNAWIKVASKFNNELITSVIVHNGYIYAGTGPNQFDYNTVGKGYLLRWDGTSAWEIASDSTGVENELSSLIYFNGKLYTGTGASTVMLYEISSTTYTGTSGNFNDNSYTPNYSSGLWGEDRYSLGAFYFDDSTNTTVTATTLSIDVRLRTPVIIAHYITSSSGSEIKDDYIEICGPRQPIRFGTCRNINLVDYLPEYFKNTDVENFLQIFEDFLNEMYPGYCGFSADENEQFEHIKNTGISAVSATVGHIQYNDTNILLGNDGYYTSGSGLMSILEKVNRLTELHDPSLMDEQYLQFFANYLGYNININYAEMGNLAAIDDDSKCANVDQEKYLRFAVENLPTWYKIKTTKNCVRVMLYSFGIIGDMIDYYVKGGNTVSQAANYYNLGLFNREDDPLMDPDYYPSPHFAINIDLDTSITNISFDFDKRDQIINAINSIRPINTVFDRISAYMTRILQLKHNNPVSKSSMFITSRWEGRTPMLGTPSQVILTYPLDGASSINPTSANFIWQPQSEARRYNIQIALDSVFPNNTTVEYVAYNPQIIIKNLSSLTSYYWRVKPDNDSVTVWPWSDIWSFDT